MVWSIGGKMREFMSQSSTEMVVSQLMMAMEVKPRRIQFSGGLIQESHEDFIGFKLEGSV